ncbi:MAG: SUMF1/EgtB/PvdO family nonheme iron enzyme [Planctomycetes bacterium]|nr:SUMF1/EgtB/PvdO family nonheme iron enzyme [Planctomycetota bacterium]
MGTKLPNDWGLFDMIGNVWEWCQDGYEDYPTTPVIDPIGTNTGEKVLRGGNWFNITKYCRSAVREGIDPYTRYYAIGVRVSWTP